MIYPTNDNRTAEQGHTARCLAAAMIAAVENARDRFVEDAHGNNDEAQHEFALWAQRGDALAWAHEYLESATMTCTCPPWECGTGRTIGDQPDNFADIVCTRHTGHGGLHTATVYSHGVEVTLGWPTVGRALFICTCDDAPDEPCGAHDGSFSPAGGSADLEPLDEEDVSVAQHAHVDLLDDPWLTRPVHQYPLPRCEAHAKRGTGTGVCDTVLDGGTCPNQRAHLED